MSFNDTPPKKTQSSKRKRITLLDNHNNSEYDYNAHLKKKSKIIVNDVYLSQTPSVDKDSHVVLPKHLILSIFEEPWEVKKRIGSGSYGSVYKLSGHYQNVAIKLFKKNINQKYYFHEKNVLQKIGHPNVIGFLNGGEIFSFSTSFLLFPLHRGDIFDLFMNPATKVKRLKECLKLKIISGVAEGLEHIHKANIIHRDLKPENILMDFKDNPIICDFGNAFILKTQSDKNCPEYDKLNPNKSSVEQCSRYYRAPEISLYIPYNFSIDIWSFVCIIFELFSDNNIVLFKSKSDEQHFYFIDQCLDSPSKEYIEKSPKKDHYYDYDSENKEYTIKSYFEEVYGENPFEFSNYIISDSISDFVFEIILANVIWEPEKRMTATQIKNKINKIL